MIRCTHRRIPFQFLYQNENFDKPFFCTYFKTSMFTFYLLILGLIAPWKETCEKAGNNYTVCQIWRSRKNNRSCLFNKRATVVKNFGTRHLRLLFSAIHRHSMNLCNISTFSLPLVGRPECRRWKFLFKWPFIGEWCWWSITNSLF